MDKNIIKLAVCDDSIVIINKLKSILQKELELSATRCSIDLFHDPHDLIRAPVSYDILLLDVNMPGMDGFEVAAYLKDVKSRTRIIFFTIREDLIQKAFEVKAFRYLYKSCSKEELMQAVNDAIQEICEQELVPLKHPVDRSEHYFDIFDIYYIESLGEGSAAHCAEGHFLSPWQLYQWADRFPTALGRPHKTYLVGFAWVKSIGKQTLVLKNGTEIPISSRNRSKIRKAMREYISTHAQRM